MANGAKGAEDSGQSRSSSSSSGGRGSSSSSSPGASGGDGNMRSQLDASRALNSEGLEGLPARALELIKLGATFYLPLWPFALAAVTITLGLYLVLGSGFIHPGRTYSDGLQPPSYIDPYELLAEEEKYLERIPFNQNTYSDY